MKEEIKEHPRCEEIKEVSDSLNKIKGSLAVVLVVFGLIFAIFFYMVKDTKSQVEALGNRHNDDMKELTRMLNEELKEIAISNAKLEATNKQVLDGMASINGNVVWLQNYFIDEKRGK